MARRVSCLTSLGIAGFLLTFACGACFLIYLLIPFQPLDIVVLGLDSRDGEGFMARTDSILLVGVDSNTFSVGLLSIPRDLFVDVPNYGLQRVNTINVLGEQENPTRGAELVIQSLDQNFDLRLDRYVRIDFQAFVALIDAVGGVDVYVERTLTDYNYPTDNYGVETLIFNSGWQHFDGVTALKYARTRYADDDYARAKRQQQIVGALGTKLINPSYWQSALTVWNNRVDTNLTLGDLLVMVPTLVLTRGNYERLVIDRDYIVAGAIGAEPNYPALQPFIEKHFD